MKAFRLLVGDLVVRKFYRAAVLRYTGVSRGTGSKRLLEFTNDRGGAVLEYAAELRQLRLYSVVRMPKTEQARRRAYAIARIAAARLGRTDNDQED
jgi:hypothetical protein